MAQEVLSIQVDRDGFQRFVAGAPLNTSRGSLHQNQIIEPNTPAPKRPRSREQRLLRQTDPPPSSSLLPISRVTRIPNKEHDDTLLLEPVHC